MGKNVFRMHVLAAGHGDCLWVDFGDCNAPHRVLVDAGTPGTYPRLETALRQVRGSTPSHALLVITHIDEDHIGGAVALLENKETAAQFEEIWFNGRRHLLTADQLQPFGAVQGERLTAAMNRSSAKWNAAFAGGPILRPSSGALLSHSIGDATIKVLTPSAGQLAALAPRWDRDIREAGLVPGGQAIRRRRSRTGWQALGASSILKLAETVIAEDAALANGTSISLLIEYCGKRMLLCGDAHPQGLVEGVRRIQPTGRLDVEILKLPHHGSSGNVTDSLLTALRPSTVVFSSSGAIYGHPDEIAVARVLKAYRQFGVHLVFNYETKFNRRWQSKKLQDEWNYTAEYGPKESGVSIFVPITGKKKQA